jgi:hypothetical protein
MLRNPLTFATQHAPSWRLLLAGGMLLTLAVLGAGCPVAARAQDPEPARKDEPKPNARKLPATRLPGLPPGVTIEDVIRESGFTKDQMRALLSELDNDPVLQAMVQQQLRALQDLRGLLANPDGFAVPPREPAYRRALPGSLNFGYRLDARLGASLSKPEATLVDQLELPEGQGQVVDALRVGSPAAVAGMKVHDIILELDGKPVSSEPTEFATQLAAIPADKAIEAVVLRRGKRETLKGLKLPEVKETRADPALDPVPGANGFGGQRRMPPALGRGFGGAAQALGGVPRVAPGESPTRPRTGGGNPVILFNADRSTAGNGVLTTTFRSGDRFTSRHEEGSLVITLTGRLDRGKASVGEIQVQDGRETSRYDALDNVPQAYRDKARHLLELAEKDNVQILTKPFDGGGNGPK